MIERCVGGKVEVRAWAQVLGKIWLLAAKPPPSGKNWICWSDSLREATGAGIIAEHGVEERDATLVAVKVAPTKTARSGG